MEKCWTQRRNFSTSCLTENSSSFLDIGTKFKLLLRTDFSESESGRSSGIVTTVLRLSSDQSQVIWGPVNCCSFWSLIWCKWLKSLELQGRRQVSKQDEASLERRRRGPLGGSGGMPPRKFWNLDVQNCSFKRFSWHFSSGKSIFVKVRI